MFGLSCCIDGLRKFSYKTSYFVDTGVQGPDYSVFCLLKVFLECDVLLVKNSFGFEFPETSTVNFFFINKSIIKNNNIFKELRL